MSILDVSRRAPNGWKGSKSTTDCRGWNQPRMESILQFELVGGGQGVECFGLVFHLIALRTYPSERDWLGRRDLAIASMRTEANLPWTLWAPKMVAMGACVYESRVSVASGAHRRN